MAAAKPTPPPPPGRPRFGLALAGLGATRRRVLEELKRHGELDLEQLQAALGLVRETLRQHLRNLASDGLVERGTRHGAGPGRPRATFRLAEAAEQLYPRREGELLAELVEQLTASGGEELLERFFERRNEIRKRVHLARVRELAGLDRLRAVAEILTEQGFLAEVEIDDCGSARIRLFHCPLRELVAVSRLPCRYELNLIEELLGFPLQRESFIPAGDTTCSYGGVPVDRLVSLPTT